MVNVCHDADLPAYAQEGWSVIGVFDRAGHAYRVIGDCWLRLKELAAVAGLIGGGCAARWSRIFWIRSGSVMSEIIRIVPPQRGHRVMSILNTLLSRWAQDSGARSSFWLVISSNSDVLSDLLFSFPLTLLVLFGIISFLSFALGAKTPWYRTRLCRGRGTSAASLLRLNRNN